MTDEQIIDLHLHSTAAQILCAAQTQMLTKLVGHILDQIELTHVKGLPLLDWVSATTLSHIEKSVVAYAEGSPETESKLRAILEAMRADDSGFHLGNGKPH